MNLTPEALAACAADVAASYRSYDRAGWLIDRLFGMEFLDDQCMPADGWHPEFAIAGVRDSLRYGFHGYIV